MTPTHFRQCLALLDWTQRGLARQLGYAVASPHRIYLDSVLVAEAEPCK